jgi:hypothetical protein
MYAEASEEEGMTAVVRYLSVWEQTWLRKKKVNVTRSFDTAGIRQEKKLKKPECVLSLKSNQY